MTTCVVQVPGRPPYTLHDCNRRRLMARIDEVRAVYPNARFTIRLDRRDNSPEQGKWGDT